jgi:hypothetical protein
VFVLTVDKRRQLRDGDAHEFHGSAAYYPRMPCEPKRNADESQASLPSNEPESQIPFAEPMCHGKSSFVSWLCPDRRPERPGNPTLVNARLPRPRIVVAVTRCDRVTLDS